MRKEQTLLDEQRISIRFERALELYDLMRDLESISPSPEITRQLVARGYYAIPSASSGQGFGRDAL